MDFSSSSTANPNQNWLGFSLSNNQVMTNSDHSFFPYLPFTTSSQDGDGEDGNIGATNIVGSPKLEDFLGASSNSDSPPRPEVLSHLATNTLTTGYQFYDSELKNIPAASFCGFSDQAQVTNGHNQQGLVVPPLEPLVKKAADNFGQRTSIYRGVTRHRWTGRYEAHLWDNSCRREGQSRKGRQVYLGGYDKEDKAARAYDLAALKYWGPTTTTNFPVCNYEKELEDMKNMTRQEFVASLRRKSSGFSRGASIYRGVTRHHQHGRWQARIGRVAGNKDLYLGTFSTQEEAAEAYDIAAIKFRGLNAVTNFDMSRYDIKSIASSNLPVGGIPNKSKASTDDHQSAHSDNKNIDGSNRSDDHDPSTSSSLTNFTSHPSTSTLSFGLQPIKPDPSDYWSMVAFNQQNTRKQEYVTNTIGGSSQGTSSYSMDFCSSNADYYYYYSNNNNNNVDFLNGVGGSYFQQQSNGGSSSSTAFATPSVLNGNNSNSYYGGGESGNFGNWIGTAGPSLHHSFQLPAKANNVSMFQTPIFGAE